MQTKSRQTSQKRNKRWALVTGGVLFLVLAPALVGYLFWARALPDWSPPPWDPPEVNAYDEYVAAAAMGLQYELGSIDVLDPGTPLDTVREIVEQDLEPLDRIRAAFRQPCVVPPVYGLYQPTPELSKFRHAARLFAAEARIAEAEGRTGEAAQRCLDAIELGGDLARDTSVLHALVGGVAFNFGAPRLHGLVPQLDSADARGALERLNRIDHDWGTREAMIEAERVQILSWMHEICKDEGVFQYLRYAYHEPWDPGTIMEAARGELYPRRLTQRNIERYFDYWLAAVEPPSNLDADEPPLSDPLSRLLLPVVRGSIRSSAKAAVERDLLRLMLALQIRHQRHGVYPKTLEPLASLLGGEVPLDPFTEEPYHYTLTDDGYRLWSVGPDGIDDNGEVALTRRGFWDERGDMVAGQLFR